jgi:hypothetical protein
MTPETGPVHVNAMAIATSKANGTPIAVFQKPFHELRNEVSLRSMDRAPAA